MVSMSWAIFGHDWAVDMLQQHITRGQQRHAYLISGPQGVGRRTLALRFAQAINCQESDVPGLACGACRTCRQIEAMQHADLWVIKPEEDAASIKVEQVRELQRFLSLAPYESPYRIALLLDFQTATASAQNAFLKTLEEPNPRVILLVTTDEPDNLLPTVVSRCELLRLRPMAPEALADILSSQAGITAEQAQLIAHISGGRPGYALRMIQDADLLSTRSQWISDLFTLLDTNQRDRLAYSEQCSKKRDRVEAKNNLHDGLMHWLSVWRDVLLVTSKSGVPLTNPDFKPQIDWMAQRVDQHTAARLSMRLEHAFTRLPTANLQLMLDNLLLEWPQF